MSLTAEGETPAVLTQTIDQVSESQTPKLLIQLAFAPSLVTKQGDTPGRHPSSLSLTLAV